MAISATWVVTGAAAGTTATQIYTVPSTGYSRDLVVNNAGTSSLYAGLSTDGTVVTAAAGYKILAGDSLILAGQAPAGAVVSVITASGTSLADVGYCSLLSFT